MAFPKTFLGFPIGWQKLGKVRAVGFEQNGEIITSRDAHTFCGKVLHVGREDGRLFQYCPRCLIEVGN